MKKAQSKLTALAASLALVVGGYASTASAATVETFGGLGMMLDTWEIEFNGNVNSFVVTGDCDPDHEGSAVAHGLACGSDGEDQDYGDIRTGLLPSWFDFIASTKAPGGWKTKVHVSFQPGGDSGNNGIDTPLGLNSSNFRQIYTSLSHDSYGTLKIGRDLGVFGSNAILEDQTLLGVGAPGGIGGGNTTLGRIGFGYIYADWKAQLQYTTPTANGLSATFALVDPWGASSLAGNHGALRNADGDPIAPYSTTFNNRTQDADTYGFEAKVNYAIDVGDGVSWLLWASYATQKVQWDGQCLEGHRMADAGEGIYAGLCIDDTEATDVAYTADDEAEIEARDIGAKLIIDDFDFVTYYYEGEGIGTTSYLVDGIDAIGDTRESKGYYMQARWRAPVGTLLGVSYGESELKDSNYDKYRQGRAAAEGSTLTYDLVEENKLFVLGAYHPVGEGLNLVLEYSRVESEAHNGNGAEEDVYSFGAIMFF